MCQIRHMAKYQPIGSKSTRLTFEEVSQALQGRSVNEAARRLGVTHHTVSVAAKRLGIEVLPYAMSSEVRAELLRRAAKAREAVRAAGKICGAPKRKLSESDDVVISQQYTEGFSSTELAEKFNVSATLIRESLARTNTQRRPAGARKGSNKRIRVRRRPLKSQPFYEVYRWFSEDMTLLYIGHAYNSAERIMGHKSESDWYWQYPNKFMTTQACPSYEAMLEMEKKAIRTEKPLFNVMSVE